MPLEFKGKVVLTSQDEPAAKKPVKPAGRPRYIKGGLLIDGNGGKPVKNPVIALEGIRIKQVGTKETIRIPAGAEVIDCGGYT
ncbi:MAG: hypothetical protein HY323_07500, partial [Betaproteobacteria bacterium]|nr:hypothetical protein [Betaproteobacteria bacterium]